jgi:phage gp36-like protein
MSYITLEDLIRQFGDTEIQNLSDRDRNGVIDESIVNEAINFAQTHIDGYLRERYGVHQPNCPANLIGMACDFARYRLYQDQPTQLVQDRYDVGCFFLKDVARGLVQLDVSTGTNAAIAASQPAAIFTRLVW